MHSVGSVARALNSSDGPRRAGDPDTIVADSSQICAALGWAPQYDNLDKIVESALNWERRMAISPLT